MAGKASVYTEIAEYLQTIHTSLIWPTLASRDGKEAGPRPDSLVTFSQLLMRTHAKAKWLLEPPPRPCATNNECRQNEECVNGVCVPVQGPGQIFRPQIFGAFEYGKPCYTNLDCRQNEECIEGVCTPVVGGGFNPEMVQNVPLYGVALNEALEVYYDRIHVLLSRVIAADPRLIVRIRELLMDLYLGAAVVADKKLGACDGPAGCPDGYVCVQGFCVPVPFRLVFRSSEFGAPWK